MFLVRAYQPAQRSSLLVLPVPGPPTTSFEAEGFPNKISVIACVLPATCRPALNVRPMIRPSLSFKAEMRWSFPSKQARLSRPNLPIFSVKIVRSSSLTKRFSSPRAFRVQYIGLRPLSNTISRRSAISSVGNASHRSSGSRSSKLELSFETITGAGFIMVCGRCTSRSS